MRSKHLARCCDPSSFCVTAQVPGDLCGDTDKEGVVRSDAVDEDVLLADPDGRTGQVDEAPSSSIARRPASAASGALPRPRRTTPRRVRCRAPPSSPGPPAAHPRAATRSDGPAGSAAGPCRGHRADQRTVLHPPVALGLVERQVGAVAQREVQLDDAAHRPGDDGLGRGVHLRVLVGQPQRGRREVDELGLVGEQGGAGATSARPPPADCSASSDSHHSSATPS